MAAIPGSQPGDAGFKSPIGYYSRVAQSVEQTAVNRKAGGSSPLPGAQAFIVQW